MPHREREVEEEGLPGRFLPLHEVDRLRDQCIVDLTANFRRVRPDRAQWSARHRLEDLRPLLQKHVVWRGDRMRELDGGGVHGRVPGFIRWDAIELVEAMRRRQALRIFAEVPLAKERRGVACALE